MSRRKKINSVLNRKSKAREKNSHYGRKKQELKLDDS